MLKMFLYGATVGVFVLMIVHGRPVVAGAGLACLVFFHLVIVAVVALWRSCGRAPVPPAFNRFPAPARRRRRKAAVATILDEPK